MTAAAAATALGEQLQTTLHREIPITRAIALVVRAYDGTRLTVAAPLAPNVNVHGTGFAGSLYSVAALCGWGMMYLQLIEADIDGSIVIADADIKYLSPEHGELVARCDLASHPDFAAAIAALRQDGKARFALDVSIGDVTAPVARFTGRYAVRVRR